MDRLIDIYSKINIFVADNTGYQSIKEKTVVSKRYIISALSTFRLSSYAYGSRDGFSVINTKIRSGYLPYSTHFFYNFF